jgi:hypothetical protein
MGKPVRKYVLREPRTRWDDIKAHEVRGDRQVELAENCVQWLCRQITAIIPQTKEAGELCTIYKA